MLNVLLTTWLGLSTGLSGVYVIRRNDPFKGAIMDGSKAVAPCKVIADGRGWNAVGLRTGGN